MVDESGRCLHQSFLPSTGACRAFVWKYSEVNKGRRPRHFHLEPELNLVVAGSATFGVGDARIVVSAGQLVGFPPGQDHVLLDASPDVYLYSIGLHPGLASDVVRAPHTIPALPLRFQLPPDELRILTRQCSDLVDREGVDPLVSELWERAHWLQHNTPPLGSSLHVLTRRVLAQLLRTPESTREQLARSLRASPSDLSRYFHRDVKLTLVQYRTRARLLQLMRLMDQGQHNLKEAAHVVGFGSYSQCHRAFHSELACGPREFFGAGVREQMQQAYAL